jgi:hypothetical protein
MSARDATRSILSLLDSLQKLSPRLEGRKDDLQFLQALVESNEFHSLIKVHHEVSAATTSSSEAKCTNALTVCHSLAYDLETSRHPETQQLFDLLTSPHMDALVSVHDRVANKEYPAVYSTAAQGSPPSLDEESVTRVRIDKQKDPLGATVKTGKNGRVLISRVLHGGAADKSGLLHAGDIIHEINGTGVRGFSVDQVAELMAGLRGTVVFKITPAISDLRPKRRTQAPTYMRTYFSYDPQQDKQTPCPEAGLKFDYGEILHIVNQDDPNWWQAVQYGNKKNTQAGIIPSKLMKEKLCLEEMNQQTPPRKKGRNKRSMYSPSDTGGAGERMVTYERVVKIEPQLGKPRPIMLVAPRGGPFDMETLRARIVQSNPQTFGSPVKHTSRPPRPGEEERGQYEFVSRQQMERDIRNNHYVEHGYFSGHYYGTSVRSIRSITDSGRTCILVLIPSVSTTHTHTHPIVLQK